MDVFWESPDWAGARLQAPVTCLSWMPLSEDGQGLLGAGSESGSVGITRTDTRVCDNPPATKKRVNFNLRGHHSAISKVGWNAPQSKLATCDETGVIYVWVPYEERWSVELVNDRGVKVRDFSWSPSGSAALICYEDNFVLIGSASGQRIWSNVFPESICAGAWSPNSEQVLLGCADGRLRLLTDNGAPVSDFQPRPDCPVKRIAWSPQRPSDAKSAICVYFGDGGLQFMESVDDPDPVVHDTKLTIVGLEWSASGDFLLVGGYSAHLEAPPFDNKLLVFNAKGKLMMSSPVVGCSSDKRLTALCWAHEEEVIVVGVADQVGVARVVIGVPSLNFLASRRIWARLGAPGGGGRAGGHSVGVDELPLPPRLRTLTASHDYHVVQCQIPHSQALLGAVARGSPHRCFCTIVPEPAVRGMFTLCMEHMGGLVPILKGRQTNKLLPEFEIRVYRSPPSEEAERDATPEPDELPGTSTPFRRGGAFGRDSMWRRSKRKIADMVHRAQSFNPNSGSPSSAKAEVEERLVSISSNMWCTRFKMVGLDQELLPAFLGQVVYKTSVLHLQPRQMSVQVVDLADPCLGLAPIVAPPPLEEPEQEQSLHEPPPIAPMDAEIFLEHHQAALVPPAPQPPAAPVDEDELLLTDVLAEFSDLRSAVDAHIARMRDFAAELSRSSAQLHTRPPNADPASFLSISDRFARGASRPTSAPFPPSPLAQPSPPATAPPTPSRLSAIRSSFMNRNYWRRRDADRPAGASIFESFARRKKKNFTSLRTERRVEEPSPAAAESEPEDQPSCSTWHPPSESEDPDWSQKLGEIQFIDDDDSLIITEESERRRLRARALSCTGSERIPRKASEPEPADSTWSSERARRTLFGRRATRSERPASSPSPTLASFRRALRPEVRGESRQLKEISSVLDKLYKLASDLKPKPTVGTAEARNPTSSGALLPPHPQLGGRVAPRARPVHVEDGGDGELRLRVQEIAARVGQLEARITAGNELLDDVRADLQTRVGRIRTVLGDPATEGQKPRAKPRVMTLQNKAPFWNEQSQVYQLDFGGRVTQESAKNFQVELEETQVMQFGRIEAGCYTLDFQAPFAAAQAFAVALASITQRLK